MTAPLPPIMVCYPVTETDAERRDRIKKGEAARMYCFMVCSVDDKSDADKNGKEGGM